MFFARTTFVALLLGLVAGARAQTGIPDFDNPNFRPASRFVETTPRITEVEVKQGDPFVEVFISGFVSIDCYDVREYHVEKADVLTRIVPRFRKSKPDAKCNEKAVAFREKAADLDPNSPATRRVDVLGYFGWHSENFKGAPTPAVTPSLAAGILPTGAPTDVPVAPGSTATAPTAASLPPGGAQAITPQAKIATVEAPPTPPKIVEPMVTPALPASPSSIPPPKKARSKKAAQEIETEDSAVSEDLDPVEEYPATDRIPQPDQTPPPAPMNTANPDAIVSPPANGSETH